MANRVSANKAQHWEVFRLSLTKAKTKAKEKTKAKTKAKKKAKAKTNKMAF